MKSGFYKLSVQERQNLVGVNQEEKNVLSDCGALKIDRADKMIENVIGTIHLPLAVATNFRINGKDMLAPMAIEEASVVAAASRAAKQTLPEGFFCKADEPIMIGQMLLTNWDGNIEKINKSKIEILELASDKMKHLKQYGCGVIDFVCKKYENFLVLDFDINVGEVQGANMANSLLESIAPEIERISGATARMKIISNLALKRKASARATWKKEEIGNDVIEAVMDGITFAKKDIMRTSTHNKGIMNGIDAVAIATGNDWRSIEAGAHTFAAINGYRPLSDYYIDNEGNLIGDIELPLAVATVGPAVNSSPTAALAIKISKASGSKELAMLMAAVGLANNFAALSALGTVGIQEGHMKLHARTIASQVGAVEEEVDILSNVLVKDKNFTMENAKKRLAEMRK